MIVNFKTHKISKYIYKLIWTFMLIKQKSWKRSEKVAAHDSFTHARVFYSRENRKGEGGREGEGEGADTSSWLLLLFHFMKQLWGVNIIKHSTYKYFSISRRQ
jgi:hypothetical protein